MTVIFNAEKFGLSKTTPYYLSGQLTHEDKIESWQIMLVNGVNQLNERDIEFLKSHSDIVVLISQGIIAFSDSETATASLPLNPNGEGSVPVIQPLVPVDITKLSVKQAEPIIKAETDINLLQKWESDPRTGIKDLVGDRLLELGEMPNV